MITFFIGFIAFQLIGCGLYKAPEENRKIDSKEGRLEFPQEAYDMNRVKAQKRKDLKESYKLDGGLKAFKALDIVTGASMEKNKIDVNFLIKDRGENSEDEKPKEKIIWENALFLYYTILDTFPDIEEISLSADYYFMDQYGNPYKEKIFLSNTNKKQLKLINRDYFEPNMLHGVIDFYMSEYATKKEVKAER